MEIVGTVLLVLFTTIGVFRVLGVPPVSYWGRSRICDKCKGVGYIKERK